MSDLSGPLEASEFQSHARFVQRLARRIEADEAAAEDLAQDTWLAAVERPPKQRGSMRAWLAQVLHNKAAQSVRTTKRREAREENVVRREPATDTADLVERMELHRHVVAAVLELSEPYRAVLVRRFFLDESATEIAERLRLPEATVRTRLRRGLEKLRTRLRGEMGGTPALFLASLRKLTGDSAPALPPSVEAPAPVLASSTTSLILTLAMKKAVLLTTLAAAAVAVVWSVTAGGAAPPQPPVEAQELARAPEPLEPAEVLGDAESTPVAEPEVFVRSEVEVAAVEPEPAEEVAAEVESPTGEVVLRIEDAYGNPIPQAKLHATQWRSVEDPGSSVWWGEEDARYMGESGPDGVVKLVYQRKHPTSNEGTRTLKSVGFVVTHPEYITHTEYGLDVEEGETVIVLERGSFLVVSGWIDSPAETIPTVAAHLSHDVSVVASDWLPIGDGRPSCSRIPPGLHKLYLSHAAADGTTWFSEVTPFELVEGEQLELSLELLPPRTLVGMVSEDVLRPVTGGEVELNLYEEGGGHGAVMLRTYREAIAPDGSFTLTGLPPGRGEIIGMCDGWVSARTQLADSNWIEPTKEGEKRRWQRMWELQQVDPAAHVDEPYVLAMVPTANAEITVLGPDGAPLAGATVSSWPNIHWSIGYSNIFLDRTWQATTNADGVALLENMPGVGRTFLGVVTTEGHLMPLQEDGSDRGAEMDLAPGETARVTVRMDPPE